MANCMPQLNDSDFDQSIATGVALIDFYADWCGPCKMMTPIIEGLMNEYKGRALVAKVDVEQAQLVASKLKINSIPTIILFVNGEEVKRVVGVRDKQTLETMLKAAIAG